MTQYLRWWRDLSKPDKERIKQQHGIKVVTFEFICEVYRNKLK